MTKPRCPAPPAVGVDAGSPSVRKPGSAPDRQFGALGIILVAVLGMAVDTVAAPAPHHWAFEPIQDPAPPLPLSAQAPTRIDAFLLARQRVAGIEPGPAADRRTLIRRATYDLTGLPPTPEEVDAFVADPAADAFARVVDRLLESSAYGERWGRKWLDLVRYADTAGENSDHPAPQAWRYRNWVIDAFNRDLPYDEFLREQLAGDLLAATAPAERHAGLVVATGFLAIARRFGHEIEKDMHLTYEDVLDTVGKSVLGLTLGCARCHDHKYDPVTMRDYYGLYGILASTRFAFPGCEPQPKPRDLVPLVPPVEAQARLAAWWADEAPVCEAPYDLAYAVAEAKPGDAPLQRRGDPEQAGEAVPRKNLDILGGDRLADGQASGRREWADWLTRPSNPLTARVMVNRIWLGHFGLGLVSTPNDFGSRGAAPSHPELLDHLATEFQRQHWSLKAMHRMILGTAAYQRASLRSSSTGPATEAPELYAHFPRRRLEAEEIRDTYLALSGELDRTPGGPHPFPPERTWGFTQHTPFKAVYDSNRRSVYLMTQRIQRHPFLGLFDGPDPNASTPRRETSTVPTQALYFLNAPFFHGRSEAFARRLLALPELERVTAAHRWCFQRSPAPLELERANRFLAEYRAELGGVPDDRRDLETWSAWSRTLLASSEVLYLD